MTNDTHLKAGRPTTGPIPADALALAAEVRALQNRLERAGAPVADLDALEDAAGALDFVGESLRIAEGAVA